MDPITIVTSEIKIHEIILTKNDDGTWVVNVDYSLICTHSSEWKRRRITFRTFGTTQKTKLTNVWTMITNKIEDYEASLYNGTPFEL
jgi:hypothetical protein